MTEYAYLVLRLPRGTSRETALRLLTDRAEYGQWELARLRLYPDGSRKATLRRRIIRPRAAPAYHDHGPKQALLTRYAP